MQRAEQETIINYNREDDEADVYTCDPRLWTRMKRIGVTAYIATTTKNGAIMSQSYKVPCSWVFIRKPKKVSEKQKALARQRMITMNKSR